MSVRLLTREGQLGDGAGAGGGAACQRVVIIRRQQLDQPTAEQLPVGATLQVRLGGHL